MAAAATGQVPSRLIFRDFLGLYVLVIHVDFVNILFVGKNVLLLISIKLALFIPSLNLQGNEVLLS